MQAPLDMDTGRDRAPKLRVQDRAPVRQRGLRQPIGIKALLEWAFAQECARVEFSERGPVGIDAIYRMMQYGALFDASMPGAHRIDGGGWTPPPADADMVAGAVAALPIAQGGRSMAVTVAEHARACRAPDWMPGARPRLVPVGWRQPNQYGDRFCVTERATGRDGLWTWETVLRNPRNPLSVIRRHHSTCGTVCPVRWEPTTDQIAAARRRYLDWWGALLHLQVALRARELDRWELTDAMPPMAPWRDTSCGD